MKFRNQLSLHHVKAPGQRDVRNRGVAWSSPAHSARKTAQVL